MKEKEFDFKESPEIQEISPEIKERLSAIAKIIGGDFGMKIEIGKPKEGSYFTPKENKITFDPLEIQEDELSAEFVAAHEGGHKAISRIATQLGLKMEKMKELYSQIGFDFMQRMIEEPAVNTWIEEKYSGLKEAISRQKKHIAEVEGAFVVDPEVVRVFKILGRIPKFAKWAAELHRYWAGAKPSKNLDDEIKKTLEATIDPTKKSYKTLPSKTPNEKEIIEKARQRFLINYKEIWPILQKLVEQDISQEEINEMLREMLKKEFQQIKENIENKPLPGPLGELPEHLQKELRERIKQAIEEMEKFMEKERMGEEKKEEKEEKGEGESPLPIPEFSKELQEKLREIFENLPKQEKNRLKEKTIEILEKVDDKLNEAVKPKLQEDKTPSHQEIKSMKIPEEIEEKPEEELKKIREKLKEETESLMSEYDRYYREVAPLIEDLYNRLEKIFLPERYPRWKKKQPSGTRLDLLEAMQFEQDPSKYTRLWETKTVPQKIDYRFMFLVDLSGSMLRGNKLKETFKGLILLIETLNRLGIKTEIMGFGIKMEQGDSDLYKIYKKHDEDLFLEIRNRLGEIIFDCGGETPTAEATKEASERLEKYSSKNNFFITLTDGMPEKLPAPRHEYQELTRKIIAGIRQKTNQKLIGIGLGQGTEMVKKFYPASLSIEDVSLLPETLSQLLEEIIRNPQKYQ